MELHILEQKVAQLVALLKELKNENTRLVAEQKKLIQENAELLKKVESLETSMLQESSALEVVDELIKSIDTLVRNENQPL